MLVIAFDGVIFDTLNARALAVHESLDAEGIAIEPEYARVFVAGRSLHEAIRAVAHRYAIDKSQRPLDETSLDIASIRANQSFAAMAQRGFSLHTQARDLLQRAASVTRIVVRADSRRREVESLIAMAGLDSIAHMTRCSDDPGARARLVMGASVDAATDASAAKSSAASSDASSADFFAFSIRHAYDSIKDRLTKNSGLLGERCATGIAIEAAPLGTRVAAEAGFETANSVSALNFPGF